MLFVPPCFPQPLSVGAVLKYPISIIELWTTYQLSCDTMIYQVPLLSRRFYQGSCRFNYLDIFLISYTLLWVSSPWNFLMLTISSFTLVCSSSFASKYSWSHWTLCASKPRCVSFCFHVNIRHELLKNLHACSERFDANMVKNTSRHVYVSFEHIQFLHGYNWTIHRPFYHMPSKK